MILNCTVLVEMSSYVFCCCGDKMARKGYTVLSLVVSPPPHHSELIISLKEKIIAYIDVLELNRLFSFRELTIVGVGVVKWKSAEMKAFCEPGSEHRYSVSVGCGLKRTKRDP